MLSFLACEQMSLGIAALVTTSSSQYVKSMCVAKKMPYMRIGKPLFPDALAVSIETGLYNVITSF